MLVVGAVILGGIKRIADTAGAVVPVMAISYIVMSLIVISLNLSAVPDALALFLTARLTAPLQRAALRGQRLS